jgi:GT2 family glycosyltransferase
MASPAHSILQWTHDSGSVWCMNKIGVVTVTYNSAQVIDEFMDSLLVQTFPNFILYHIDNASTDQTLAHVARHQDSRISVIANSANVGFAQGSNQGIRAAVSAGCSAVLLINNDTEFGPSLLQTLVNGLNEHAVDMVAPKILLHDHPDVIWSAGGGLNAVKGHTGFHYGLGETDRGQFDTPRLVDHAPACCLLIRSEVFGRIGLMDERFFVYVEDTDFCYRAKAAGMKLLYLPGATILHKASSLTGGVQSDFTVRSLARNQIYFLLKHFSVWRLLYYVPAFQFYQLARLLSRRIKFSGFLLRQRALVDGIRMWKRHGVS